MDERQKGRRSAEAILADWRHAERQRDEHDEGSEHWTQADREVDRLKSEYHDTVREVADVTASSMRARVG